ncbi:transglutaminase domain-containing protein [Thomasclavelia cocleata]|uniref:transglutaminase domain-containing protein n=2 Tax=Thomasclavelia cocleata TaxID=69824 RepID=UPI0025738FBD|nr:transglutaminase domain-containing protein [Thomasclavelia cocleata]
MKKLIITITNILMSLALTCGSTTEYIKFNVNDLMRADTFLYSAPEIREDEPFEKVVYTVIKEKKAEKPEPVKEEETTPTPEPVKKDDPTEKVEPVKKETTPTPEPVNPEPVKKEEPQPQKTQDTVASGNIINFNNNINKRGGVETLPEHLQGYADQIMGVCLNVDEMTHCFHWAELSSADMETIKQAINRTYFAYYDARIIINYWDEGEYYLTTNNSRERYNKSLEVENNIKSIVNNIVTSDMTEKDAVIAINNYVCSLIDYELSQGDFYLALQTGKGNCRTYACIFKMMCNQIGIECDYIEGFANGGGHAWNRVYIGGVPYWVDACWNDGGNQYLLSADLWENHSVSTVNQFFYSDEF